MSMTPKQLFKNEIESVRDSYIKDLEAMSQEQLNTSPGGSARTPFDFTFETVFINGRVAQRLRGETPATVAGDDGWMKAPPEFCDKSKAIAAFRTSMDDVLAALESVDDSRMLDPITLPNGSETSCLKLAYFACMHNSYHDAQLNYLQAIHGDEEVHWG